MAATLPPKLSRNAQAILRPRQEPGRLPAAALALAFHAAFFVLIVFGVSWQVKVTAPLMAEVWDSLPTVEVKTPDPAPVAEFEAKMPQTPLPERISPPKVVEPPTPSKADIAFKARKLREEKLAEKKRIEAEEQKRVELDAKTRALAARKAEAEQAAKVLREQQLAAERARVETEARDAAVRAARDASIRDYSARIAKLVRDRATGLDAVTGKPVIQVRLRLLVNGVVFDAQVIKPSGNGVYDAAVERAINGIKQWPLPDDPSILGGRRELTLNIEHER